MIETHTSIGGGVGARSEEVVVIVLAPVLALYQRFSLKKTYYL